MLLRSIHSGLHAVTRALIPSALIFVTAAAPAQLSGRATVQGTITDPSGAIIPQAVVTVVQDSTNTATTQTSTSSGF